MRGLLERHTDLAIFLILFLEDLGVPMPIPADVVIMYAGYRLRTGHLNPVVALSLMVIAVNIAASVLYFVVRRGGRPLVDRFGQFIHLDAAHLSKAEGWLQRRGALSIVIGRALPGVRLATVIACGLFGVPYRTFAPAQFVGTLIYMIFFLLVGYTVGPQAAERIHLPAISLRLIILLIVAIALPLLLRRLNRDTADDDTRTIQKGLTRGERFAAAVLGGFAGMIELTMLLAIATALTNVLHETEVHRAALALARWIQGDRPGPGVAIAYTLDYAGACLFAMLAAVIFFQYAMPLLHLRPRHLMHQTLLLWFGTLSSALAVVGVSLSHHFMRRPGTPSMWLSHSGLIVLVIIAIALFGYAYVAVATRRLAIDQFSDDPEIAPSVASASIVADPQPPASGTDLPSHVSNIPGS